MPAPYSSASMAASDLGLGSSLSQQVVDETEEQKRRRRLGLSPLAANSQSVMSLFPALAGVGGIGAKS